MAKVFISATSDVLAAARSVVKQGLLTINLEVVESSSVTTRGKPRNALSGDFE